MKYKLATSTWDKAELDAINRVIESDVFSMSTEVQIYERDFASYFGSKYAIMTSSGSTANLIMTAALFFRKNQTLKAGDEIIVPSVSWSTTYFPLQQYGLKLKFIDIDLETLNFDLVALKEAVTNSTKAILAVNLLGNSNNFEKIAEIIGGRDILILEDNCESMGASFKGKKCGTYGLMGTFSSFFSHHIATMEGGMVLTDDEECYHLLLSLRAHGWTRNLPKDNLISPKSDNWFEESFNFILPGYNVRPLEMSGAIGQEQLKKLDMFIDHRRKNAELFLELMKEDNRFHVQKEIGKSSWFGFSLIIREREKLARSKVIDILTSCEIETRPIVTGDFTKNKVLKYFNYIIAGNLKNSKLLDSNGFFIGNSHEDLSKELYYFFQILKDIK